MTERCLRSEATIMNEIFGLEIEDGKYKEAFERVLGTMEIDNSIAAEPEKFGNMETLV